MKSATTIRRANPDDKGSIWAVRTRAIAGIPDNFYNREELERWRAVPMPESFGETIRTKIFMVAEIDRVIVGHGFVDDETGQIEAIFVDPGHQRRGIGMQLLAVLERMARTAGLRSLQLSATLNSVPFYERAGFTGLGISNYRHPNGFDLACVLMQKSLDKKDVP